MELLFFYIKYTFNVYLVYINNLKIKLADSQNTIGFKF